MNRLADQGLEALGLLLLVVMTSSIALVPGQPKRLGGGEMGSAAAVALWQISSLQKI